LKLLQNDRKKGPFFHRDEDGAGMGELFLLAELKNNPDLQSLPKNAGYLGLTQLLDENTDVLMLVTNSATWDNWTTCQVEHCSCYR
jgi:hypothetical protein